MEVNKDVWVHAGSDYRSPVYLFYYLHKSTLGYTSDEKDTKSDLSGQSVQTETHLKKSNQKCIFQTSKCGLDAVCKNHIQLQYVFFAVQNFLNQSGYNLDRPTDLG